MKKFDFGVILPRSTLFSIEPIGLGTPFVESLTSYISRIAECHCVLTGALLSKLLAHYLKKHYITAIGSRGGNGFYDSSSGVNGIGTLANDFVKVIEMLTCRSDLKMLTLLPWANITSTRDLLSLKKKWCPSCFDESIVDGTPLYESLIWCFKESKYCIKHHTPLLSACENCSTKMNYLSRNSKPGFCDSCNNWLGNKEIKNQIVTSQLFERKNIEVNIGKMLAVTTSNEGESIFKHEMVSNSLKFYLNSIFHGNTKEFSYFSGIPYSTFRYWVLGDNLPPLSKLNSICTKLEVDFLEFFEMRSINGLNVTQKVDTSSTLCEMKRYDHQKIKSFLQNEINNPECNSLSQIAKIIGCDRRLLSRKHPVESKRIVDNYQNKQSLQKIERQDKSKLKLIEAFGVLEERNIYPSRRVIEKELGGNLLLKEKFLRETWDELKSNL